MIVVLGRGGKGNGPVSFPFENRLAEFSGETGEVSFQFDLALPVNDYRSLEEAEIISGVGAHVTSEIIEAAKHLKWLHLTSAGVEHLPFRLLTERRVLVTNSKGLHGRQMAEQILGMMIAFTRGLHVAIRNQGQSRWDQSYPLDDLRGKMLVIVGAGSIGRELARKARTFDMDVLGVSRTGIPLEFFSRVTDESGLEDMLRLGDFVAVLVPLTNRTRLLIGKKQLALMKPSAIVLNYSRGDVVDEEALILALKDGTIGGAGLDVFSREPLAAESPLWRFENVIISPHYAGTTRNQAAAEFVLFKSLYHLYRQGKPMYNLIDLSTGY